MRLVPGSLAVLAAPLAVGPSGTVVVIGLIAVVVVVGAAVVPLVLVFATSSGLARRRRRRQLGRRQRDRSGRPRFPLDRDLEPR